MDRARRVRKWVVRSFAALALPVLGFLGWNLATDNFETVEAHRLYRSGQMQADALARTIRKHQIKTVLNLRGSHPEQVWYATERKATLDHGATQVDMALSSCEWMSRVQLRALVHVLESCERPLLIHCWRGSERTGWASALDVLLRPGSTLEQARAQFALRYLFARVGDGKVMIEHLDEYESWLKRAGLSHTPDTLRRWVNDGFQPHTPGREQWPYDPYPLVVINRPEPPSEHVAEKEPKLRK